jgi:prophage regulatory protein
VPSHHGCRRHSVCHGITPHVRYSGAPCASAPWPQVNRHQSQLYFDNCGAEIIGRYGPDCAYRWWTNSKPSHRSKFNADLSRVSGEPAAAPGLHARKRPQIQHRLPADRRLEFRSQYLTIMAMQHNSALPSMPTGDAPRVLARLPTVLKITGLGRSTIYRWIAEGSFPAPVRLGRRAVAWRWSDLDRWTQSRDTTQH